MGTSECRHGYLIGTCDKCVDENLGFTGPIRELPTKGTPLVPETKLTGGKVNYYLSYVAHPQREEQPAYQAECEDLIESLALTPDEANIFKEIWRSANARLHNGKPGHKALYGAEKIVHYAGRILRRVKRMSENADNNGIAGTN